MPGKGLERGEGRSLESGGPCTGPQKSHECLLRIRGHYILATYVLRPAQPLQPPPNLQGRSAFGERDRLKTEPRKILSEATNLIFCSTIPIGGSLDHAEFTGNQVGETDAR